MLTDDEFLSFLKALGLHIRHLRKQKKINMRDIMISTGFYDTQWRKYEAGGGLNLKSLMKIAQALNVSLVDLLDGLGQWPVFSVAEIQAHHHLDPQSVAKPKAEKDARMPTAAPKTQTGRQPAPEPAKNLSGKTIDKTNTLSSRSSAQSKQRKSKV